MHILLTDRLSCPRCGPEFGLILLADRIEDRRVHEGTLGCPNCRDRFPVTGGFGDLRAPPRAPLDDVAADPGTLPRENRVPEEREVEETTRLAALLGVARGPGHLALVGPVGRRAGALADFLDEVEVIAIDAAARALPEREGVSRIVAGPGLPFFSRTLRGVALSGDGARRFLAEAARVVAAMGRVVVLDAPDPAEARAALESAGLSLKLEEGDVVVAER